MKSTKNLTKVTPVEIKSTKQKQTQTNDILSKIQCIVYVQAILGINRTYLINSGRFVKWLTKTVCIMRGHVKKNFEGKEMKESSKVDALANNTQLDTISLHRTYELLHKCAEQLNSIMSFPMMIALFCSGLSTTMLLKSLYQALQIENSNPLMKQLVIIYCVTRCIRYTILVVIPCYYSSVTTRQVFYIRATLHEAANSGQLDIIEKRRVKTFFHLTRENEFAYALWGVIRLNMSLPLSYFSLCTTYLVIIIQFSKFID
ncbi:uncharacterized protein LOC132902167 [Amyelois transitella]|uniref:uncharacterized protein LOC132902167 n=1 Tax=Amyelois transitella TaxID=680683 RepID=UPI002990473B|nr:uncharacterized protein LOC132902167 [Amyelois transitella]